VLHVCALGVQLSEPLNLIRIAGDQPADAVDQGAALREVIETMIGGGAAKIVMVGLLVEESGMTDAAIKEAGKLREVVATLLRRAQATGAVRRAVEIVLDGLAKGGQ